MESPEDTLGDAVERLEFDERGQDDSPNKRMRQISRRAALTGGAAGIAGPLRAGRRRSGRRAGARGRAQVHRR